MGKKKIIEKKEFGAEIGNVLQLMIHALYTTKHIFLRELISNASDACDKLRYAALQDPSISTDELGISIKTDPKNGVITITDNGIGMNKEELIENLGTIARSGTQRFIESLKDAESMQLIGQFGVGFYSAYMVADKVIVESTRFGEGKTYIWESTGQDGYTIAESQEDFPIGTRITLILKPSEYEFLETYRLQHIIKSYSDHISFPISLIDEDNNSEVVNKASALWIRAKSEIIESEYNEFYHHISHSPDTPWLTLHHKAEGAVDYISLIYIPSVKPYDLFHPDRQSRLKLYVKRVFITENESSLIPPYLRFLQGVVDSEDLPLNISRETLQNNHLLGKIKQSIVKKVLSTLKEKAINDKLGYQAFWANFGEVMKEGLCEGALAEKEQLLEVCYFKTNRSGDGLVSLDEYISNMQDGQEEIFYLNGASYENLEANPALEGFNKRDIEVILLSDHVDDFWINVITQYKNKALKSIVSSNIDLNSIKPLMEDKSEDEKPRDHAPLLEYLKKTLGSRVKDVILSAKLVESPSALAIVDGAMNIRMEKFLIAQKQLKQASAKILEINASHPILRKISESVESKQITMETEQLAQIIFQQACLVAGEGIDDPMSFVKAINALLVGSKNQRL